MLTFAHKCTTSQSDYSCASVVVVCPLEQRSSMSSEDRTVSEGQVKREEGCSAAVPSAAVHAGTLNPWLLPPVRPVHVSEESPSTKEDHFKGMHS